MADILTIEQYLSGKVRNIKVPDNAISTIIMDAGITSVENPDKDTDISKLSLKERELCLAWLYVWIAGSPTQSGGFTEQDADWQSRTDGERMSASVLKQYLAMANEIFKKYGMPLVGGESWGFVGRGIRNPRRYR
jgi:hypothetical protein